MRVKTSAVLRRPQSKIKLRVWTASEAKGLMIGKQSYVWIMRPIFMIAPCKGLQGDAAQSAANQARNTGANPFS